MPFHVRKPRVDLSNGRDCQATAQWEVKSNGFPLLFEALLLDLMKRMPIRQVGRMVKKSDNRLWSMMKRYTELNREEPDYSEVTMV